MGNPTTPTPAAPSRPAPGSRDWEELAVAPDVSEGVRRYYQEQIDGVRRMLARRNNVGRP